MQRQVQVLILAGLRARRRPKCLGLIVRRRAALGSQELAPHAALQETVQHGRGWGRSMQVSKGQVQGLSSSACSPRVHARRSSRGS